MGLTGLYILDTRSLLQLAKVLGRGQDVPALEARLRRAQAGLETLWDEDFGFYCNRRTDTGAFSHRISPTNFYALFDRSVPKARRERIAAHYWNPEEFYGEWMLPAIARNDPAFPEQDYWRGRVWAPLNFLVYLAFCQHADLARERADLAEKSAALFLPEWQENRHIHENYNAVTGQGCDSANSDKFYHWGALLGALVMAEKGLLSSLGADL